MRSFPQGVRRVGVAEPDVRRFSQPIRLHPGGLELDPHHTSERIRRATESYSNPQLLIPKLREGKVQRGWTRSWAEHVSRISEVLTILIPAAHQIDRDRFPGLFEAEMDNLSKLCLQDGGPAGWDIHPEGLRVPPSGYNRYGEGLAAIASLIPRSTVERARAAADELKAASYPRGTNHGLPSLSVSDLDLAMHAGIAAHGRSWTDLQALYAEVATEFGLEGPLQEEPTAIQFSRTGTNKRYTNMYGFLGEDVVIVGESRGLAPRRRVVWAIPSCLNIRLGRLFSLVRSVHKALPYANPRTPGEIASWIWAWRQRHPQGDLRSDDLSGFDLSVPGAAKAAVAKHWAAFGGPSYEADISILWEVTGCPVLGGPLSRSGTGHVYHRGKDVVSSGERLTSNWGSDINRDRCLLGAAAAMQISVQRAAEMWFSGDLLLLIQGDDTVVGLPVAPAGAWERFTAETSAYGLKNEPLPGAVFLMKYFPPEGGWFPLASRVYHNSVWREHPASSALVELLGLASRSRNVELNPLGPIVLALLQGGDSVASMRGDLTHETLMDEVLRAWPLIQRELTDWRRQRLTLSSFLRAANSSDLADTIASALARGSARIDIHELAKTVRRSDVLDIARYLAMFAARRPDRPPGIWGTITAGLSAGAPASVEETLSSNPQETGDTT